MRSRQINELAEKLKSWHYIFGAAWSGADLESGGVLVVGAHALGQNDAETIEQRCLCRIGLGHAAQGLLDHAATDANAAHKPPIAVNLPVLPYRRVARIHTPKQI